MKRRSFLLGSAFIAAGCGSGGSSTTPLVYRRVNLGNGIPLGLDDSGNAYMKRMDGSMVRWSEGTFTSVSIDTPAKSITRVRPDGTLVAREGYFTTDGVFHPLRLPTFEELGIAGPTILPSKIELKDANTRGEFIGTAYYADNNSFGPHSPGLPRTRTFVMRQTGPYVLPALYEGASQILENGYFTAWDPTIRHDAALSIASERLFGPDNALAEHPINRTDIMLGLLTEDLTFSGLVLSNPDTVPGYFASGNRFALVPDSRKVVRSLRNFLVAPTGELFQTRKSQSLEPYWHLILPDTTEVPLTNLVSPYQTYARAVGFNARREILGIDGIGSTEAFLLMPVQPDS